MKKLTALLLTLVMILTACGNSDDAATAVSENEQVNSESSEKATEDQSTENDQEEDQVIEVSDFSERIPLTFGRVAFPLEGDTPVVEAIEEKYNIDFDFINFERTNEGDLVALMIASGEVPDIFEVTGNMVEFDQYYKQGILRSIPEEYLKTYAPTVYQTQEQYLPYLIRDGEIYGIVGERLNNVYPLNAIWRQDWLENVGIDKLPETIEEAETAFYAIAKEDPDGNGKDDTYGLGKSGLDMVFGAFGGIPWGPWEQYWLWQDNGNGELEYSAVRPGMKEALALLSQWYADGVLDPEYIVGENKGGYWAVSTDFVNNKIGFTGLAHFYHWVPPIREGEGGGPVYKEFIMANPDGKIGYGRPVVGPNGDSGTWQYQVGVGAAEVVVISSETTDEQVIRYLQILEDIVSNKESRDLIDLGIEGIHWTYNENGDKIRTEAFDSRDEFHPAGIALMNTINTLEHSKAGNPELYAWGDEHYDFPGYRSDLVVGLPSESMLRPDLDLLRDEYYISIITGDYPIDAFDEFVEKWYELGGDTLTEEANAWYDTLEK